MEDKKSCNTCKHKRLNIDTEPCHDCARHIVDSWESAENTDNAEVDTVPDQEYPTIKDSGERREFQSGAVRDCAEGKGRCDLLPLDVVADLLDSVYSSTCANVLRDIGKYMADRDEKHLYRALKFFACIREWSYETMALEYAKHLEEGAKKYAERNWEKGIPAHCYIDSAVRHLLKYMRGDTDEPHDRAFVWNMFGLIWTMKHKPECDDLPRAGDGNTD